MENGAKRTLYLVATLALLVISAVYLLWAYRFPLIRVETQPARQFAVNGEGKVSVRPDVAVISAAIETEGPNPATVQRESDDKVGKLVAYLRAQGIDEKRIHTIEYNLSPNYIYPQNQKPRLIGYTLLQGFTIKVSDLAKAGELVGNLTAQGVNRINGISFDLEKIETYRQQARLQAIENARTEAKRIAGALKVQLGRVLGYSEGSSSTYESGVRTLMSAPAGGEAPIQAGSQEVRMNVTITFELQ